MEVNEAKGSWMWCVYNNDVLKGLLFEHSAQGLKL